MVTAPQYWEVSLDSTNWSTSLNIAPVSGAVTNITVYARFSPILPGSFGGDITFASLNAVTKTVAVIGTVYVDNLYESTITENPAFVYTTNIPYADYQSADITAANSVEVAGFTIVDDASGDPSNLDGASTTLNSITFSLSNFAMLQKVALYDGATELGEVSAAATVNFSGLTLTAVDNGTKNFTLRATFNTTVTDHSNFQFTITNVTYDPNGSGFTGTDAGGASSNIAGNNNKISVTASKIVYGVNAATSVVNVAMTPSPTVRALDANNNLDLDYTSDVNITSTGTLAVTPTTVNAVAGVATFSALTHTQSGLGLQITASSGAFTPIASALFDVYNPIFVNQITATNPSALNPFTTGQIVDTNLTVSGIGRSAALTAVSAADRYAASGFNTPSYDATRYFEFTITPNPGYEIDFSNFIYTGQASGSRPTAFSFRSSVDNYASEIGTPAAVGANISLAAAAYQDIAAPITFRIYGYGASAAGGTFSVNGFTFNGSVTVSPIASISALPSNITTLDYFVNAGLRQRNLSISMLQALTRRQIILPSQLPEILKFRQTMPHFQAVQHWLTPAGRLATFRFMYVQSLV
ncbi:hypothetical protein [Flavobacterium sp. 3HN19-14]|uniref:hypothetical protein n=1 Tax=Flavobacterium sp. 3HN19-14 TaxID=3448133 RepID=UPI003EE3F296